MYCIFVHSDVDVCCGGAVPLRHVTGGSVASLYKPNIRLRHKSGTVKEHILVRAGQTHLKLQSTTALLSYNYNDSYQA